MMGKLNPLKTNNFKENKVMRKNKKLNDAALDNLIENVVGKLEDDGVIYKDENDILHLVDADGKNYTKIDTGVKQANTVGDFIDVLKQLPQDAEFELNGIAKVKTADLGYSEGDLTISPMYHVDPKHPYEFDDCGEDCCGKCECDTGIPAVETGICDCNIEQGKKDFVDYSVKKYLFGVNETVPELIHGMRHEPIDKVIYDTKVCIPNAMQLDYEAAMLSPNQCGMIDEMRHHNAYVAECIAEMTRRQVSALLEYNTQAMANFAIATKKDMCHIVEDEVDKFEG